MLRSAVRRAAHVLCAVAACSAVLIVAAPAASADPLCVNGRPSVPGVHLPCNSAAPNSSPAHTDNLGRKL